MNPRAASRAAGAVLGLLAVAFGAFGAHGLTDPAAKAWMQTGAAYQLAHVLAALFATLLPRPAIGAANAFLIGAALFGGSLYAMALGAPRWLGMVTPLGGLGLIAGWVLLILACARQTD